MENLYNTLVKDDQWLLKAVGRLLVKRPPEPSNSWSVKLIFRPIYIRIPMPPYIGGAIPKSPILPEMDFDELPFDKELKFTARGKVDIIGFEILKNKTPMFSFSVIGELNIIRLESGEFFYLEPTKLLVPLDGLFFYLGSLIGGKMGKRQITDPWEPQW